jgi:hypothetical protein
LNGSDEIKLSYRGQAAAKEGLPLLPYSELNSLLQTEVLQKTLLMMKGAGFLGLKRFSIAEFEQNMQKQLGISGELARLHLMWLLKYGCIEVNLSSV